jgi:protein-tyrosine phosphatase
VPTLHQRARLARDGIFNLRDLGGVPVAGGGRVAHHRVLRGDSLHRARGAADVLAELGVVRVLDLRDERERELDGVLAAEGIEVQHHPVIDPMFEWTEESVELEGLLAHRYREILTVFGGRFSAAITSIAEVVDEDRVSGSRGAVAYHCAVGKDRTGLLTALLLGALGADDDAIVADYARSGAASPVQVSWLWSFGHPDGQVSDDDLYTGLWSALPATMGETLRWLDEEFGGTRGYLEAIGVPDEVGDSLRAALLTEPADEE